MSERRGILLLVPMIIIISVVLFFVKKLPSVENKSGQERVATIDSMVYKDDTVGAKRGVATTELFVFDPNTADFRTFLRLGLSKSTAAGIIKYRQRGKVFGIKEEFAACYGLSDDDYFRLEPYIVIGERFRPKPFAQGETKFESRAEPKEVVEPRLAKKLLVELNSADSTALRSVNGIGAYTVVEIINYRWRLGGFARVEQLAEVKGMKEENFERICTQIYLDSCGITKIDINFASSQQINDALLNHPYAGAGVVRKLLKTRQLKGGWRIIGDMVKDKILTDNQAAKLEPYLVFIQ